MKYPYSVRSILFDLLRERYDTFQPEPESKPLPVPRMSSQQPTAHKDSPQTSPTTVEMQLRNR